MEQKSILYGDLISRNDLIEQMQRAHMVYENGTEGLGYTAFVFGSSVRNAPAVDAVPVVHGQWIMRYDDIWPECSMMECSVCHEEESMFLHNDKWCPNCGARMETHKTAV